MQTSTLTFDLVATIRAAEPAAGKAMLTEAMGGRYSPILWTNLTMHDVALTYVEVDAGAFAPLPLDEPVSADDARAWLQAHADKVVRGERGGHELWHSLGGRRWITTRTQACLEG